MKFWYGVIRNAAGNIRFLRVSDTECPTQELFLKSMEYAPAAGDIIVELDRGDYMSRGEFVAYVHEYFMHS